MPENGRGTAPRDRNIVYRPALDGIRAVAVLGVIAYHFGYRWAPGGFLGVDMFFVLSGYLITSLLLAERERSGEIALRQFWLRRARRLLPALFLMLLVVTVWIGLNTSPYELQGRRDDLLWTLLYGSNWHFIAAGQDYFAQYASASPLRHTWSLAIEEQFYILWPLIVAGALWFNRRKDGVLAAICILGIVASTATMASIYSPGDPSRAYYGTDTRIHQLLVGCLLGILMQRLNWLGRFAGLPAVLSIASAIGLLIAFATLSDQSADYYKGLSVLLATTTAALVWSVEMHPGTAIARILSFGPLAWIGRLSYGLYLWHWPVILAITSAPTPLRGLPGATTSLNLARLVVTFCLAVVSFYLLEQPIRRGSMPILRRSTWRFVVAAGVAILMISGVTLAATAAVAPDAGESTVPDCPQFTICLRYQGRAGAPVIAVIGDLIARSLDPAFLALAREHGWTYVLQANNSCRVSHLSPADVTPENVEQLPICFARTVAQQNELLAEWRPRVVVMADLMETLDIMDDSGQRVARGSEAAIGLTEVGLTEVATRVTRSGARFALLELPPRLGPDCAVPSKFTDAACTFRYAGRGTGPQSRYDALYEHLAATIPRVSTISITSAVCPDRLCRPVVAGTLLRWDGLHYTANGARALVSTLDEQLGRTDEWPGAQ